MLRSLQPLRETSPTAALIAGDEERLMVTGGGGSYRMPWHWHDCLMILLPSVGAVDFQDETRRSGTWLSEDRFVVVPKTLAHQTAAAGTGHCHVAIYATDAQLAQIETRVGSLARVRTKLDVPTVFAVTPEIRSLQALCRAGEIGDLALPEVRGHLAAALFIRCLTQIEQTAALSKADVGSHGDLLVSEIRSFIQLNASEDLSLDAIAETFGLSRRHATRLFREKTGLSIAGFHERERIGQARKLLTETALPIGEIAWRVGFESASALARTMRRVLGLTPTSVRSVMARFDKS